jgi:hypothetical protein
LTELTELNDLGAEVEVGDVKLVLGSSGVKRQRDAEVDALLTRIKILLGLRSPLPTCFLDASCDRRPFEDAK